jgi:hypothetical protein
LGDQAGKKKITIKQFKEFNQQKGITVLVDNLDRPKTSAYFKLKGQIKDYDEGFSYVKSAIETKLKNILKVKRSMKTHLGIKLTFAKKETNSEGKSIVEYEDKHLKTKPETISSDKQIISTVQKLKDDLKQMVAEVSLEGSQWSIVKIHFFFIECVSIRVSRGASYIPTPAPYNNAKCGLINIKNESDEECFKWRVKYHQTKQEKNDDRVSVLKKIDDKFQHLNLNLQKYSEILRPAKE